MERKLLVVDDEEGILDLIERFFSTAGYRVTCVPRVSEAIRLIASTFYPVVITDLAFPGSKTGLDVLAAAKKRSAGTEVIIITGYGSIKSAVEAMRLGAYDYITKPFDLDELKTKVGRLFEALDARRALDNTDEFLAVVENAAGENIGRLEWLISRYEEKIGRTLRHAESLMDHLPKGGDAYRRAAKVLYELKRKVK